MWDCTAITTLHGASRCVTADDDDLIDVAKVVNACLHKMNPSEGQASDQPGVAGRDEM